MMTLMQPKYSLSPMTVSCLDAVLAVEQHAYAFPWTRGNFIDSLAAGYGAEVLTDAQQQLIGYFVAMSGVEEMHLLNITVAPEFQGQGHARTLFEALLSRCRAMAACKLWLEVRQSNARAQAIYKHLGFVQEGVRKAYYPAALGKREDAVVMALQISAGEV